MTELHGERVVLRSLTVGDRPLVARWFSDRELRRWVGRRSPRSFPSRSPEDRDFLILLRQGRRPIGICGLYGIRDGTGEVGILLGEKDTWGHGYGPEALSLLLGHAQRDLGLDRVTLCVHATNARAIRAYTKVGFSVERRFTVGRWLFGRGAEMLAMARYGPQEGVL